MPPITDKGLGYERILRQLHTSVERLGLKPLDMYLAHDFDPATQLEDTVAAFKKAKSDNIIKDFGISNFNLPQLQEISRIAVPRVLQNSYSLLDRTPEKGLFQECKSLGVEFHAYSPLAGGWLTGKYKRDSQFPENSRMTKIPDHYASFNCADVYSKLEELEKFATKHNTTMSALALRFLLFSENVQKIVIGPRNVEQLACVKDAISCVISLHECEEVWKMFEC